MTDETEGTTVWAMPEGLPPGEPAMLMTDATGRFVPAPEALQAGVEVPVLAVLTFTGQSTTDLRGDPQTHAIALIPSDLKLLGQQLEGLVELAEEAGIL